MAVRRLNSVLKPLRIHYLSDLHLEKRKLDLKLSVKRPDEGVHGLVLAGDIGNPHMMNYKNFIADCSRKYKNVYIVAGNHEFDGNIDCLASMMGVKDNIMRVVDDCNESSKEERVKFLDNSGLFIKENLYLYGTTLWSTRHCISDVDVLINRLNEISVEKLVECIDYFEACNIYTAFRNVGSLNSDNNVEDKVKMLVVSHYPPSMEMISDKYRGGKFERVYRNTSILMRDRFANDLDKLVLKDPVKWWICGHSHDVLDVNLGLDDKGKVRCVMNAVGYPKKNMFEMGVVIPVRELVLE